MKECDRKGKEKMERSRKEKRRERSVSKKSEQEKEAQHTRKKDIGDERKRVRQMRGREKCLREEEKE